MAVARAVHPGRVAVPVERRGFPAPASQYFDPRVARVERPQASDGYQGWADPDLRRVYAMPAHVGPLHPAVP